MAFGIIIFFIYCKDDLQGKAKRSPDQEDANGLFTVKASKSLSVPWHYIIYIFYFIIHHILTVWLAPLLSRLPD